PESTEWVTFIHGAGGSSSIWFKQIKAFKENFNVLLVDLRGHGRSQKKTLKTLKEYTFKAITKDVIEVLDHLRIKSSHFVGISLGTIIIRELAEISGHRVKSLVMGGAIMKMNFRSQILMKLGMIFKSVLPYMILYRFFAWVILPRKKHRHSRNLFIREAKRLYQKEFIRWFKMTGHINKVLKLYRTIETGIPTLYVMGDEDYMFLPPVKEMVKSHSRSYLQVLPNCGHVVNVDEPRLFNQYSIDFINKNS
ncbi:MAG: alpha/beta hydrolase, partial [Saprospiraceae bacterium]|nr:alpha/beta hydrolase [Saprospiraceae bacterium]